MCASTAAPPMPLDLRSKGPEVCIMGGPMLLYHRILQDIRPIPMLDPKRTAPGVRMVERRICTQRAAGPNGRKKEAAGLAHRSSSSRSSPAAPSRSLRKQHQPEFPSHALPLAPEAATVGASCLVVRRRWSSCPTLHLRRGGVPVPVH